MPFKKIVLILRIFFFLKPFNLSSLMVRVLFTIIAPAPRIQEVVMICHP